MGKLDIYKFREPQLTGMNVALQGRLSVNEDDLEITYRLFSSIDLYSLNRACYIFGFGSQPKSVYRRFSENEGNDYKLIWQGYNGPRKFKFLSFIAASTSGFIKVKNSNCITSLIRTLGHQAMVGVFFMATEFSAEFEKDVLENLNDLTKPPEESVKKDNSFFYFIIDGDTYDDIGFLCENAFGIECPIYLSNIGYSLKRGDLSRPMQ